MGNAGAGSGPTDAGGAAGTPRAGDAGTRVTPPQVTQLAERSGFGELHATHAVGGGDLGCLSLGLAVVLLGPGIGLAAGSYGPAVTALGAAFLALAVTLVPLTLYHLKRSDARIPRVYLFDGGVILTRPKGIAACPWSDLRVAEYTTSVPVGQGGATTTVNRLRLDHADGTTLLSTGAALPTDEIVRIAIAGGART
jgi:hypothetical protein